MTHTTLSQIQGRKRLILFSPEDSAWLYDGAVDPDFRPGIRARYDEVAALRARE